MRSFGIASFAIVTLFPIVGVAPKIARANDAGLLRNGISAQTPNDRFAVATLGGYDSVRARAVFQSRFDVRMRFNLTLMGAVALTADGAEASVQPRIGLRLQLLSQSRDAFDLALGGGYRRDRFREDEGMVETFVAFGRRSGSLTLLANLSAGVDLEGDDRKGSVALTLARDFGRSAQLGIALNAETDLASTDARRAARGDSIYEGFAGAIGTCTVGQWALLIEAGPSVIKTDRLRSGLVSLGGAATVF